MDKAYRDQFPNLVRWFETCVGQPQFQKVLGSVTMLGDKKGAKADAAPKAKTKEMAFCKRAKGKDKKAEASPKAAASPSPKEKGKKEEKAAPPADTPEIAEVKKQIAAKKDELKAAGKKGKEVNEDPDVVALVAKMKALQSGAPAAAPAAKPAAAGAGPDEKELKAIKKEGGKKGSEIAGAADMGGMSFMNCSLDSMELGGKTVGEVERMVFTLTEMNRPVKEGEEEAKGGSGHVAKAH